MSVVARFLTLDKKEVMKITVIGSGYVGLVTGACFAETGNQVVCVDIDENKVQKLKSAEIPFYEPGLAELVTRNQLEGRLQFTSDLREGLQDSTIVFICVGTPSKEDGSANLDYVMQAARDVAVRTNSTMVAIKSTVPVGTAEKVKALFREMDKPNIPVISNPEFLREGSAVGDCLKPDRVVLGMDFGPAHDVFRRLYQPFVRTGNPIYVMDNVSAEMTKYVSNCILATRISFVNEMSMLCEQVGGNIELIRKAVGSDHRIGMQYLFPSIGFGGSCFPKDLRAMASLFRDHGMRANMVEATLLVNDIQKNNFCERIEEYFKRHGEKLEDQKIAIWGAAFKARTDDIRESPALGVIDLLIDEGAKVSVYDPKANTGVSQRYGNQIEVVDDPYDALEQASALCVLTEWNQFRDPDFEKIGSKLARKVVFDGRNLYHAGRMKEMGFDYFSIGYSPTR